jgi:hypothetical protein
MSTTITMEDAAVPIAAPTMEEPMKRLMITKMVRSRCFQVVHVRWSKRGSFLYWLGLAWLSLASIERSIALPVAYCILFSHLYYITDYPLCSSLLPRLLYTTTTTTSTTSIYYFYYIHLLLPLLHPSTHYYIHHAQIIGPRKLQIIRWCSRDWTLSQMLFKHCWSEWFWKIQCH